MGAGQHGHQIVFRHEGGGQAGREAEVQAQPDIQFAIAQRGHQLVVEMVAEDQRDVRMALAPLGHYRSEQVHGGRDATDAYGC
ncbi:hypothetical protein D9M68_591430 [compost metagenome]